VRATLGESFYNVDVTFAELWIEVGKLLERARLDRKWKPIDVERQPNAPSYKTVQAIEAGEAGTVESLDKYATALGINIVDVIYSVLSQRETPLTPEAAHVVRIFSQTTVAGRTALLAIANALPHAEAVTGVPPIPADAPTPPTPRQSPLAPLATKRRTAR
jgi:hypothetical protein